MAEPPLRYASRVTLIPRWAAIAMPQPAAPVSEPIRGRTPSRQPSSPDEPAVAAHRVHLREHVKARRASPTNVTSWRGQRYRVPMAAALVMGSEPAMIEAQ